MGENDKATIDEIVDLFSEAIDPKSAKVAISRTAVTKNKKGLGLLRAVVAKNANMQVLIVRLIMTQCHRDRQGQYFFYACGMRGRQKSKAEQNKRKRHGMAPR